MGPKKSALATVVIAAGILQVAPVFDRKNPPVHAERSFERHLQVPQSVHTMMRRACLDCHSNETQWPWYSRVAPLSWAIGRDVQRGRSVLNFSEWSVQAGRRPEVGASMLAAACAATQSGRMPRFPYGMVHPEARLSPEDIRVFCEWTSSEVRRLIKIKRDRERLVGRLDQRSRR